MRIAVSGASGLIGSGLVPLLRAKGHQVLSMVRGRAPGQDEIGWDPANGEIDAAGFEGLEAVVHLSGENISGRFTEAHKRAVKDSRVRSTRLLAQTLARRSEE